MTQPLDLTPYTCTHCASNRNVTTYIPKVHNEGIEVLYVNYSTAQQLGCKNIIIDSKIKFGKS